MGRLILHVSLALVPPPFLACPHHYHTSSRLNVDLYLIWTSSRLALPPLFCLVTLNSSCFVSSRLDVSGLLFKFLVSHLILPHLVSFGLHAPPSWPNPARRVSTSRRRAVVSRAGAGLAYRWSRTAFRYTTGEGCGLPASHPDLRGSTR